jgi:peptidyl-prolyl cis-trans isomerase SurA
MDNNKLLLKFNDTKLTYLNFANYIVESSLINETNYKLINDLYIDFINQSIMNYYKSNLLSENQEYRYVYNEYKEGLLLFDLMESEVWNKAKDDTLGLKKYFNENKSLFNDSEMVFNIEQEIPGEVISKYQVLFEKKWIKSLREKKVIFINRKVLKKTKQNINK